MKKIAHNKTQKKLPHKRIKTNKQTRIESQQSQQNKQTRRNQKEEKKAKATTTKQLKLNYYVLKNTQVFS